MIGAKRDWREAAVIESKIKGRTSRLRGFYRRSPAERAEIVSDLASLCPHESELLAASMEIEMADKMVENVVGRYTLPLGIGANFLIDGQQHLIPMAIEEPSVVAGVSSGALLARAGGGFHTGSTEPVMIAQIQLLDVPDAGAAERAIHHSARPQIPGGGRQEPDAVEAWRRAKGAGSPPSAGHARRVRCLSCTC